jgi:predicted metal-binding membrane protein
MSSVEALLKQDRRVVLAALVGLIAVSWSSLWFMARGMNAESMSLMMTAPGAWTGQVALAVFLMWGQKIGRIAGAVMLLSGTLLIAL